MMKTRIVFALLNGLLLLALPGARADEPPKKADDAPIRGRLQFQSRDANFQGTDAGVPGDTHKYIAGHLNSPQ